MTQYQLPFNNPDLADGFGSTMYPRTRPHRGLDFAQSVGTPYGAIADGVIADKAYGGELGYYMVVGHPDGMYSGYCHSNQASSLAVGAPVTRGQTLNLIGNTGFITGPHLHLTLSTTATGVSYGQVQDPYDYIMNHLSADPAPGDPPPVIPPASLAWTTKPDLRPSVTVRAASGKIRITIGAYGAGALLTYSVAGVRSRDVAIASAGEQRASIILVQSGSGTVAECSTSRTWIQEVPSDRDVLVTVECYGLQPGAFVASPSLVVEVVY